MLKASFYVSTKAIAFLAQERPETWALYTLQVQKAKRSKMPSQKFTELANGLGDRLLTIVLFSNRWSSVCILSGVWEFMTQPRLNTLSNDGWLHGTQSYSYPSSKLCFKSCCYNLVHSEGGKHSCTNLISIKYVLWCSCIPAWGVAQFSCSGHQGFIDFASHNDRL